MLNAYTAAANGGAAGESIFMHYQAKHAQDGPNAIILSVWRRGHGSS